jgi:hypothetical protein
VRRFVNTDRKQEHDQLEHYIYVLQCHAGLVLMIPEVLWGKAAGVLAGAGGSTRSGLVVQSRQRIGVAYDLPVVLLSPSRFPVQHFSCCTRPSRRWGRKRQWPSRGRLGHAERAQQYTQPEFEYS